MSGDRPSRSDWLAAGLPIVAFLAVLIMFALAL